MIPKVRMHSSMTQPERLWTPICRQTVFVSQTVPGAHAATAEYAAAEWRGTAYETSAERLDGMRRNRNRTEYDQWYISASVMESDLEHAREIVKAVESALK
jgi:hypothetical protein